MGITTYSLQTIRKELQQLDSSQISALCLRLAKYKKENKELLSYLLFEADNEPHYIESVKQEMEQLFKELPSRSFQAAKSLRKVLRLMNKHVKFMASKAAEIELLVFYGQQYLQYIDRHTSYKPVRQLLIKPLEKAGKLVNSLHEDLQYDHLPAFEQLVQDADTRMSWINKHDFL
ncbi:hypothetical protein [Mucilaginibacter robiniae]|uniref:hypothetical protein n=1 Tax=Mucilaginibacter robiniae TaxID=2728022 RepID=UPI001B7D03BF|nr:hypothetical protein [Mucilaginibacter robiniae]